MGEFVVGLGLRPGTSAERIVRVVRDVMGERAIECLATIDRRAVEVGMQRAAAELAVRVQAFSATELAEVTVPKPDSRTAAAVGTPSVAEAAALLASAGGPLVVPKRVVDGVVVAVAERVRDADSSQGL
ncbi:cobalamin biosynthesis protein [Nocardia brasiliensis]|uniref:cobalamin biosynthesis protein n=1 Tax=Nocardia brasiliensis TaxID=37326 RepID=UPI001E456BB0|nr:cobalamin biosynthesis protein [Nocardia brasiliensis]